METHIRLKDFQFFLYDVLKVEELCQQSLYKDHSKEVFDEIIEVAKKIAEEKFEPVAAPYKLIKLSLILYVFTWAPYSDTASSKHA